MMKAPITTGRVVVGVDGSAASIDAIGWAWRYAELTGARLEALTSWLVPHAYVFDLGYGFETTQVDWEATAREIQKNALDQALPGDSKGLVRTVVQDHPAEALVAAAEGADLLVVGSRGHGGFAGMLLGSVSSHVVAHASCAVVVVPHLRDHARHASETPERAQDATSVGTAPDVELQP
jgi:nucleotide-binding universal stress UspA family protein